MTAARAAVLEAPRRLRARSFPVPEVGDDDGLLRVEACGLCGTDHEQYTGHLPAGFAFVPGHEAVGVVEAVGDRAAERWGVRAGDRVAVEVFLSCRSCAPCRRGEYRRCERHGLADMYGLQPVDKPPGLWGGYGQYQYLAPDSMLLPVPEGLDPVLATVFNPLGAGVRWGAEIPGTAAGDVVAVLGPGIRGLSTCVAAREAGAPPAWPWRRPSAPTWPSTWRRPTQWARCRPPPTDWPTSWSTSPPRPLPRWPRP
jgi:alcohol dehydrogenase